MSDLRDGTVTFLLTDVEGSTVLWEQSPDTMRAALARHDALFDEAVQQHRGVHIRPRGEGDSRFAVFAGARDAALAALVVQRTLAEEPWPTPRPIAVRIGIHTGEAALRDGDYYGSAVNRCARLRGIGHGGQTLVSAATAALVRESLPNDVSLLDLGEHRLKDLTQPERVSQLVAPGLRSEFPPLASLDARSHNLPVHPTALLGRERELAEIHRLFEDGARLVTLTGPGGTGKTRLSIQVAAELIDRVDDGVFLVDLAPLSDPSLVPTSIAQTLGARDIGERSAIDALKEYLRARSLLLVLDNFEQILPGASVVAELMAASPGLRILVTSRAPLRLRGEHEFPVPPLALPDTRQPTAPAALSQYAAVALFLERATTIRPGFALTGDNAAAIAEICTRLDGLPLAIELAAARVRLLTPQAIVQRLDHSLPLLTGGARDLPARQQTLRDTIAWSHDLLDEPERRLFRRLAVFVGGWTLESAHAVCDIDRSDSDTLDGLESLVAKSLVLQDHDAGAEVRFRLFETIREFAQEQLETGGELPMLRRRHVEHFLMLAEEAEPYVEQSGGERWLDRLQAEHDNLRAALAWSRSDDGDVKVGIRLAGAIARFWQVRSHLNEGERWYNLLLPVGRKAPGTALVKALNGAGWLAHGRGDERQAAALFEEAVALARQIGDRVRLSTAVGNLGVIMESQGNYALAETLLEESLTLCREQGNTAGISARLHNLGNVACAQGDFERATTLLEESLAIRRRAGGPYATALVVGGLGLVALYQDDHDRALVLFGETLTLFRHLGHTYGIAWSLYYLGRVALLRGAADEAAPLLRESLDMRRRLGDRGGIAQSFEGFAALALLRHRTRRAVRLFAVADRLREEIVSPLSPAERAAYDRDLRQTQAQTDETTFATAWADGRAFTMEQAISLALDDYSSEDAAAGPS